MSLWHCDTPDQARTYPTQAEADAVARDIRRRHGDRALVVVWESSDLEPGPQIATRESA